MSDRPGYRTVERPALTLADRLVFPAILKGMAITASHIFEKKVTMQYPEEKWTLPEYYRGVPSLVMDDENREKCVACSLCEFVCPPRAITIVPEERPGGGREEKQPAVFDIDMLRCIFCGYCEEVCPEEAIFMSKEYEVVGRSREEMVFHKDRLYEIGGVRKDPHRKWKNADDEARAQGRGHGHGPAQV
ncbi:MAG: NADH-quinone oxidoreductase subunit NuoI [Planctomycetaceae bacterium]|nr:NADH-quinone oxidoreductase subunit NuoI [Planctomycetota bacterium]NUN51287.1 NADH-quinone oxidoreductase subunit NuoI [Planctomycetaceae bacterium]